MIEFLSYVLNTPGEDALISQAKALWGIVCALLFLAAAVLLVAIRLWRDDP